MIIEIIDISIKQLIEYYLVDLVRGISIIILALINFYLQ